MNLPYIQSELFRELVGLETLLKPEYYLTIIKSQDIIVTKVVSKPSFRDRWGSLYSVFSTLTNKITKAVQIIDKINPKKVNKP